MDVIRALRDWILRYLLVRLPAVVGRGSDSVSKAALVAAEEIVATAVARGLVAHDDDTIRGARSYLLSALPPESWGQVPTFARRAAPVRNTWEYQNHVQKWSISPGDLVLDVGSGGWPFSFATHLADRFPDSTSHRVEKLVRDDRPFIAVNLERLPFRNLAYDFVFCSHVLEHLERPGDALRELMRVARRGYIEVPTRMSDVLFNFTRLQNHHKWHGLVVGKTLVLIEWGADERVDCGNHFFEALHSPLENAFQDFFEKNRRFFFAGFEWQERIAFLIIDSHGNVVDSDGGRNEV